MILINPSDDISEKISSNMSYIVYKYENTKTNNGTLVKTVTTNLEGLKYGFPIYDWELSFIKIKNISNLSEGILYSNHSDVNSLKDTEVIIPSNPFIKKNYDPIISFKLDNSITEGSIYLIKSGGDKLRSYLNEKNKMNFTGTSIFTGSSVFLKEKYISNYSFLLVIFCLVAFIPVFFAVILFSVLINYQLNSRFNELVVRHIYFSNKKRIIFSCLDEFILIVFSSSLIGTLISIVINPINYICALLLMLLLNLVYFLMIFFAVSKRVRKFISRDSLEFYRRKIE